MCNTDFGYFIARINILFKWCMLYEPYKLPWISQNVKFALLHQVQAPPYWFWQQQNPAKGLKNLWSVNQFYQSITQLIIENSDLYLVPSILHLFWFSKLLLILTMIFLHHWNLILREKFPYPRYLSRNLEWEKKFLWRQFHVLQT